MKKSNFYLKLNIVLTILMTLLGCAHKKISTQEDPLKILKQICAIGAKNTGLVGSLWLRTDSPELKGQFPADIKIQSVPVQQFRLEITNLLGGVQAVITMDENRAWLEIPGEKKSKRKIAELTWAGIPIRWASKLFLGQTPCSEEVQQAWSPKWKAEGILSLTHEKEEFEYTLQESDNKFLVSRIIWKKNNTTLQIEVAEWDKVTGEALRWFVKSPTGELRIKWKDRKILGPN